MAFRNAFRRRSNRDGDIQRILADLVANPTTQQQAYDALRDLGVSREQATALIRNPAGSLRASQSGQPIVTEEPIGDGSQRFEDYGMYPEEMNDLINSSREVMAFGGGGSGRRPATRNFPAEGEGNGNGVPDELREMSPGAVISYLEDNADSLTDDEKASIVNWLEGRARGTTLEPTELAGDPADWVEAFEVANNLSREGDPASDEDQEANEEAAPSLEEYAADWRERLGDTAIPRANLIDVARNAGAADPEAAVAEFEESQQEGEGDAEEGDPDSAGFTDLALPEWVLQTGLQLNQGVPLTEVQMQRIVDYWNLYHGDAGTAFNSIEDVAPLLADPNRDNQMLVEAAVLDDVPERGWTVKVPGKTPVSITESLATNLFENYGFDLDSVNRLARLTAMTQERAMLPYPDPQDNMLLLAGLMSAWGVQGTLAEDEQNDQTGKRQRPARGGYSYQDVAMAPQYGHDQDWTWRLSNQGADTGIRTVRSNWERISGADRAEINRYIDSLPDGPEKELWETARAEGLDIGNDDSPMQIRRLTRNSQGEVMSDIASPRGVQQAQARFRRGFERYNDVGLAMIYSVDTGLAARIAATGGDPSRLSPEDELRTWSVIRRTTGQAAKSWLDLAPDSPLGLFRSLSEDRLGGGAGGGAGRIRRVLDPVQVKQQFSDLYGALLLQEPSEAVLNEVYADLQAKLDAAEEGMDFDASARIREWVEGSARFKELYAKRPAGMNPEQYLGMFEAAGQSIMGAEGASVEALESGLKSGQYQTTVGASFNEGLSRDEATRNSRMFGRLAEVADIFGGAT